MTKLRLEQAPVASLPRRFLLSAPLWGLVAGALLMLDGPAALQLRWAPATLALVHVFTLGVLGNAMFGSLLQFLPAAAGVSPRGGVRLGFALHAVFNLGVVMLVLGMHQSWRGEMVAAAAVLLLAFLVLALMVLPGLLAAAGHRLLRAGIGIAVTFALATALLGGLLVLGLGGHLRLPLAAIADVHASWGVLGWVVVLLASVARVVMPMFQGTGTVPAWLQAAWLVGVTASLVVAGCARVMGVSAALLGAVVVHVLLFVLAVLWLQWKSPRFPRTALLRHWRVGMWLLLLAAGVLPVLPGGMLAGALGLAIALPLLVTGMMLEIVPFIGWIELHRRCGRGIQVPGVQRLLPNADKQRVLLAQLLLLSLPCAVIWPSAWLARAAGLALVLSWSLTWWTLFGTQRRAASFLRALHRRT